MTVAFALGIMQQADSTPVSLKYREKRIVNLEFYTRQKYPFSKNEAELIFPDM